MNVTIICYTVYAFVFCLCHNLASFVFSGLLLSSHLFSCLIFCSMHIYCLSCLTLSSLVPILFYLLYYLVSPYLILSPCLQMSLLDFSCPPLSSLDPHCLLLDPLSSLLFSCVELCPFLCLVFSCLILSSLVSPCLLLSQLFFLKSSISYQH